MLNFFSIAIALSLFQEFYPAKSRASSPKISKSLIAVMTALFLECRAARCASFPAMIISEKIMKEFSRQLQAPQCVILPPPPHHSFERFYAPEPRWNRNGWLYHKSYAPFLGSFLTCSIMKIRFFHSGGIFRDPCSSQQCSPPYIILRSWNGDGNGNGRQ